MGTFANGSAAPSTGEAWSEPFLSRTTCTTASVVPRGRGPCWSRAVGLTEAVRTNECWRYWCSSCLFPLLDTHTQAKSLKSHRVRIQFKSKLFLFFTVIFGTQYICVDCFCNTVNFFHFQLPISTCYWKWNGNGGMDNSLHVECDFNSCTRISYLCASLFGDPPCLKVF